MANRPRGFGLSADITRKMKKKYDVELEQQARVWIEGVIGEQLGEDSSVPLGETGFHQQLKDGVILCKLMNQLSPNSIRKVNTNKSAFYMMENIANFLKAIESYGVLKNDLFQTVDLYDNTNMLQVVNTLHALGRKARQKGYPGPCIGPKEAEKNERSFTDEQLMAGNNIISLQMGTNKGASQAGMNFGKSRSIVD
ncbi:calponin-1-like [Octopus vulgaris]|nr:calponin-1 [Octopus sinensis]CAI9734874.1 calponin-1-like [Octopus vulgaris]